MGAQDLYRVFVDTGAFIALIDERDPLHELAQNFYTSLDKRTNLITSLMIISETYTWLRYHAPYDLAARFIDVIERSEKVGALKIILLDDDMKNKAHAVLKNYRDQDLSYTDATSFVILETMNIADVFGFDSHFYIIKRNLWPVVKKLG